MSSTRAPRPHTAHLPARPARDRRLGTCAGCAPRRGLLLLALAAGAGAACFAVLFRWLITTFTHAFTGHADYAAVAGESRPGLGLGRWFLLATPVVAGLLYGPLVHFFAREARGHGVPEVMYAVARRGGRIAPQVAAVKALASALCIGGGGSVGREGPIVQIGSALGSTVGAWSGSPSPGCGCWSRAVRPAASRRRSTPRSPASSSRWS